ncbi:MAG: hypothetical protein KC502_10530 [Myxococcales bacterium]|nr:hypothetical protein [Myxococcales bacterium]
MSDATPTTLQAPTQDDIAKLIAHLRDDQTLEVRSEVADRLVVLAAREPHERAKGALLERAANLVGEEDPERELLLLRESFRHYPRYGVGVRLCEIAADDESLAQLGRLGQLFDAVAALAPTDERPWAQLRAARAHVEQGHGQLALAALKALGDPMDAMGDEPKELREIAESQVQDRHEMLTAKRMEIAEATDGERGTVLLEYAQLLLAGDEPLADASAVLADAIEAGADAEEAAPLWAEVARAVGDWTMLGRALAASLGCDQPMHIRLRTADELANRPGIDRDQPSVARQALEVLAEALPDDLGVRSRLLALSAIDGDEGAAHQLDQLRLHTVKERDRDGEAVVCLALARVSIAASETAQAERYMRRVRALDPRNGEALDFFETQFRDNGDTKRLYMVLSHRLPGATGSGAIRIASDMAALAENDMDSPERAIEAWQRVRGIDTRHTEADAALERLYRQTSRWSELRDVLVRQSERAKDAGDNAALADILARRAALHGPDAGLAEPAVSLALWRRVASLAPERDGIDDALDSALRGVRAWPELAERLAGRLSDEAAALPSARALLALTTEQHDDPALAAKALDALVQGRTADGDDDALIEATARQLGEDKHLLTALSWRRPSVDGDDAVELLEEAGALAAWALDDKPRAIKLFEDLRSLKPSHPAALRGLSRLFAGEEKWAEQVEVIGQLLKAKRLPDEDRVQLLGELATAHADGLGDLDAAVAVIEQLSKLAPESPVVADVQRRSAVARGDLAGLRQALPKGADGAATYVEQLETIAAGLEGVLAVAPLRAAADAADKELNNAERAVELCGLALLHTSDSEDDALATAVANELLALAKKADDDAWTEQALSVLATRGSDKAATHRLMAARAENRDDWEEARSAWELALQESEESTELVSDSERLCDAAERAGQASGVVVLIAAAAKRHMAAAPDDAKAALVAAVAWAAADGVDLEEAQSAVDAALDGGEDADLLHVRELVLIERGAWAEVVETLERAASLQTDEERVETLRRAAGICDGGLDDAKTAARLYALVVELSPDDIEGWTLRLAACERVADDSGTLAALDAFLATSIGDRRTRASATVRRIELTDGDDHDTVIALAGPVLAGITADPPLHDDEELVLAVITGRLDIESCAKEAAAIVSPAARTLNRWDDVLRCVEILSADVEPGSAAHISSLLDQAELAHAHADDGATAIAKAKEAVALAPDALESWARALLIADARKNKELDGALDLAAGLNGGNKRRASLLHIVAGRAADADDTDRAIAAWGALKDHDPTTPEAYDMLEMLYREAADLDSIALHMTERLDAKVTDDDRELVWLRLAQLHADERQEQAEAIDTLHLAVLELPKSEALWATLLDTVRGDNPATIKALQARLATLGETDDDADTAELCHRELADLLDEDRAAEATAHWAAVLTRCPEDEDVAARAAANLLAQADPGLPAEVLETAALVSDHLKTQGQDELLDALLLAWAGGVAPEAATALFVRRAEHAADAQTAFNRLAEGLLALPGNATLVAALDELEGAIAPDIRAEAWSEAAAAVSSDAARAPLTLRSLKARVAVDDQRDAGLEAWLALWRSAPASGDFDGLVAALGAAGRQEEARALQLERLDDAPDGVDVRTERVKLAETFAASGNSAAASAQWQQLVLADPTDAEAVATLRKLASTDPERADTHEWLAAIANGIEDASTRATYLQELAEHALEREAWTQAADVLDTVLAEAPANADAFALRDLALGSMAPDQAGPRLATHLTEAIQRAGDEPERRMIRLRLADHEASHGAGAEAALAVVHAAFLEAPNDERADLLTLAVHMGEGADAPSALLELLREGSGSDDKALASQALRAMAVTETDADDGATAALKAIAIAEQDGDDAMLQHVWDAGARSPALVDALLARAKDDESRVRVARLATEACGAATKDKWLKTWISAAPDDLAPLAARFALKPSDAKRWKALSAHASAPELILDALLGSLELASTPASQAAVLTHAAELAAASNEHETAAAYAGMALEHGANEQLQDLRRGWLMKAEAYDELAELLESEAESTDDADTKIARLDQAADLWLNRLDDAGRASKLLALMQELSPDNPALAVRKIAVQRAAGDADWAAAAIAAVGKKTTTNGLALAIAAHLQNGDIDSAFTLSERVAADGSLRALGDTLDELGEQADLLSAEQARKVLSWQLGELDAATAPQRWASLKLRWLTQSDDVADQLQALDDLVEHAMGPLDDPSLALDWIVRALLLDPTARDRATLTLALAETPDQQEMAFDAVRESLTTAGGDQDADLAVFAALLDVDVPGTATAELLVTRGRADSAFATAALNSFADQLTERQLHAALIGLRRAALAGTSGHHRVSGLIDLADGVAQQGDVDGAIHALLDGCPDVRDPEALIERAQALAESANNPAAFVDAVEMGLGGRLSEKPAVEQQLISAAAGCAAGELDDAARGADLYNRLWERDPDDIDARDAVLAFRRAAGDTDRLADDLDRAILDGGDGTLELRTELAGLLLDQGDRADEALRHLKAVLRKDAADSDATAVLERLADHRKHGVPALTQLETAYRAQGDFDQVATSLQRHIARLGSDTAAHRQLESLAEVLESQLAAPGRAAQVYARLVLIKATTARVRKLLKFAPEADHTPQLGSALEATLGTKLSDKDRATVMGLLLRGADTGEDASETETRLRQLIALQPDNEQAWDQLDELLETDNRWPDLVATLKQRVELTSSPEMKFALQNRLAGMARASGLIEEAVAAYEALSELDPTSPDALEALVELLAEGDTQAYCDALARWAERLPKNSAPRCAALLRAARLCANELANPARATELYQSAFDTLPSDDESFRFLERQANGDPQTLLRIYRRRAEGVEGGPARTIVLRRLAAVSVELGKHDEARAALAKAAENDPNNEALQREMIEVCEDAGDIAGFQRAAARRLEGDIPRVERVMLTRKLAHNAVEQNEDADRWLTALEALSPTDPDLVTWRAMVQARSEDPETAAKGIERVLAQSIDAKQRVALLWRLADLYTGALDRPMQVLNALQRLLKVEPGHWDANEKLCTLYAARGSQEALAESLRHWADAIEPTDISRAVVLAQLGGAYLQLNQGEDARKALEEAYALDAKNIEINQPLAMVWTTAGKFEEAADLQAWVVEQLHRTRQRERLPAAAARAGMLCERIGRNEEARKHYRTALKGTKGDIDATLGLGRVSAALGDDTRALAEFERVAAMGSQRASAANRSEALLNIGLLHKKSGRRTQARNALNRALELKPDLREAVAALADL